MTWEQREAAEVVVMAREIDTNEPSHILITDGVMTIEVSSRELARALAERLLDLGRQLPDRALSRTGDEI